MIKMDNTETKPERITIGVNRPNDPQSELINPMNDINVQTLAI